MRKTKLMRTIFMMLLFSFALSAFAGCESSQGPDLSDKGKFIEQLKQDANVDSGIIQFTADPFVQHAALSWMYSIDVKIDNGNIYLNDTLYDGVEIISNPAITYDMEILWSADTAGDGEKISEVLGKIKSSEDCYMLESKNGDDVSQKYTVYKIDGVYYFLSLFENGEVMRIHFSNIK